MAAEDINDDEYVARLIKQDALDKSQKYDYVGMAAFKRPKPEAPKPNTSFLRHIIRQTDSHNATLRAKETKESRARLLQLDTAKRSDKNCAMEGNNTLRSSKLGREVVRRERRDRDHEGGDEECNRRSHTESRHDDARRSRKSRRDGSSDEYAGHQKRRCAEKARDSAYHPGHRGRREYGSRRITDNIDPLQQAGPSSRKRKLRRSVSRCRSRTRSASPASTRRHKASKSNRRSRSPRRRSRSPTKQTKDGRNTRDVTRRYPITEDESDPLETIVGPLPLGSQAAVRSRGRGTRSSNAEGMDARFSSEYDPAMDIGATLDDGDEWSDAMEAFRDRQRWKQQGAARLKAAGFSEEQVYDWGRGDEKNEQDVRWSRRGQAREWDRGKVTDADGDVGFKPAWTDG